MVSVKEGPKGLPESAIDMTSGAVKEAANVGESEVSMMSPNGRGRIVASDGRRGGG